MLNKTHKAAWYRSLPKVATILVIISAVNFVVMLIHGYLAELELRNSGFLISHWSPYRRESLWLVIAAICLINTKLWILLVSVLTSGWVLYDLSYVRWTWLARNAFELPILSWVTTKNGLRDYFERPEIIFELILALSILICAIVYLNRLRLNRKVHLNASG